MMQWLRAFTLSGNKTDCHLGSTLMLFVGILGACLTVFGNLYSTAPQFYYVPGSILLLISANYFKLFYFIALEVILLSGHGTILLGIGPKLQVALPLLLSFQLLVFYILSAQLNNLFIFLGIIGISILSIGFAVQNQLIFLIGGISIAAYSFYLYFAQHTKPALIWAVLNSFFALSALCKIILF